MREGRRQRLGLQEGTEGTVQDTYLDRILEEEGPRTLALDPDAFVDTTDQRYVQDAYNYYLGGGFPQEEPVIDTPVIDTTPVVDAGGDVGQDLATGGVDTILDTGDAPINVDTPLTQIITTPTGDTMTVKEAMTSDDAYSLDTPIDIGYGEGQVDPGLAAAVGGVDTTPVEVNEDLIDRGNPLNDPRIQPEEFGLVPDPEYTDQIMDSNLMDIRQQQAIDFAPEQQGLVNQAFSKVGSTASDIMNDLSEIPGAVADFANQTVDVFGKKINVGKTLLSAGINKIVGGPISLVFDALGAIGGILPKDSLENSTKRSIAAKLTAENNYGYNMQSGNIGQDPFGRNPVSAFGDYEQTLAEDAVSTSTTKMGLAKKQYAEDYFNAKAEVAGGVGMEDETVLGPGEAPGDLVSLEDQLAEQAAAEQAQAAKIEAERRELQEINARAEKEAADAQAAANAAAAQAAAIEAQRRALQNINAGGGGGGGGEGARSGGSSRGGTSSTSSGLGGLGFSDIRLKDNVELIGKSPSNINIYKFNYKGNPTIYQGAMAHEVSWASVKANNGYLMIDYDKIDVEFKPYAK